MFIDLLFCNRCDGKSLAYAPAFNNLIGREVIVKTKNGAEQKAIVEDSITIDPTSEEFKFILKVSRETKPLCKVISLIKYNDFLYDEETEDLINGTDNDNE